MARMARMGRAQGTGIMTAVLSDLDGVLRNAFSVQGFCVPVPGVGRLRRSNHGLCY